MERDLNSILSFLEGDDEWIIGEICRDISERRYEYQGDEYKIPYEFCDCKKNENSFWSNYIEEYPYLYFYLALYNWKDKLHNKVICKRYESFISENKVELTTEMSSFIENKEIILNDIPDTIFTQIGFIIDSYLWLNKLEVPVFMRWAKDKNLLTEELYDKYCHLLIDSLKDFQQENINHDINVFIYFCKATDLVIGQGKCFYTIMEMISDHSINSQKAMPFQLRSILERNISIDTLITIINFYYINSDIYNDNNIIDFCTTSEERAFWTDCIEGGRYAHLLTFSILEQWQPMSHWIDDLKNNHKLEKEMRDFLAHMAKDANSIPFSIIIRIGFIIDSFLWKKHKEIPRLFKLEQSEFPLNLADDYKKVLLDEIKENDKIFFNDDQEKVLRYCLTLDLKSLNNNVFRDILKLTSRNESNDLSILLINYPYYGDDFGLTLLAFCKENKNIYRLSSETISAYEYHLCKDSWLTEIKRKLGNNSVPYNSELCKQTCSHNKIVEEINSKESALWDELCKMTIDVVDDVRIENPSRKRSPVRITVYSKTMEICTNSKKEIFSSLHNLLIDAKKEGILLFIDMCKEYALKNGKKIALTQKVLNAINEYLVEHYIDETIPSYSIDFKKGYRFAKRVAYEWVIYWIVGSDDMMENISENQLNRIRDSFNTFVWEPMKDELIQLCTNLYGYATWDFDSSTSNNNSSYGDNYSTEYDNDDYGIYSGGAFM